MAITTTWSDTAMHAVNVPQPLTELQSSHGFTSSPHKYRVFELTETDAQRLSSLQVRNREARLQRKQEAADRRCRERQLGEAWKQRADANATQLKHARQQQLQQNTARRSRQKNDVRAHSARSAHADGSMASSDCCSLPFGNCPKLHNGHVLNNQGKTTSQFSVDAHSESPQCDPPQRLHKPQCSSTAERDTTQAGTDYAGKSCPPSLQASSMNPDSSLPSCAQHQESTETGVIRLRTTSTLSSMVSQNELPYHSEARVAAAINMNMNPYESYEKTRSKKDSGESETDGVNYCHLVASVDFEHLDMPASPLRASRHSHGPEVSRASPRPEVSLMPRKELLRERQRELLKNTDAVHYKQHMQRHFDKILDAVEFSFSDSTRKKTPNMRLGTPEMRILS